MKTHRSFILLLILILVSVIPVFADEECDQSLKDAKALYNAGMYKEAKSPATTLSASKTQVNVYSNNATEYITISSNKSWHISQPRQQLVQRIILQ